MSIPVTYNNFSIKGPVGVEEWYNREEFLDENVKDILVYILLGATGSGKSAFIESLAPDSSPQISKDSLESVTQYVQAYELMGVPVLGYPNRPILLLDTPGFLDLQMSEYQVLQMVDEWLNSVKEHAGLLVHLLYFDRITDAQMTNSKKKSIQLLKEWGRRFSRNQSCNPVISVVSTMWNYVYYPRQMTKANKRFKKLQRHPLLGLSQVFKFDCSQHSSLGVLDRAGLSFTQRMTNTKNTLRREYANMARAILEERIHDAMQEQCMIDGDLQALAGPRANSDRKQELLDKRDEIVERIRGFSLELSDLEVESDDDDHDRAHKVIVREIAVTASTIPVPIDSLAPPPDTSTHHPTIPHPVPQPHQEDTIKHLRVITSDLQIAIQSTSDAARKEWLMQKAQQVEGLRSSLSNIFHDLGLGNEAITPPSALVYSSPPSRPPDFLTHDNETPSVALAEGVKSISYPVLSLASHPSSVIPPSGSDHDNVTGTQLPDKTLTTSYSESSSVVPLFASGVSPHHENQVIETPDAAHPNVSKDSMIVIETACSHIAAMSTDTNDIEPTKPPTATSRPLSDVTNHVRRRFTVKLPLSKSTKKFSIKLWLGKISWRSKI